MTTRSPAHGWTCTSCLLEIRHHPTFHVGLACCCAGCVAGGPCVCSYDEDAPEATLGEARPAVGTRIPELAGVD